MLSYCMYIQEEIDLLKYMFKRKFYLSACIYIKKGGVGLFMDGHGRVSSYSWTNWQRIFPLC